MLKTRFLVVLAVFGVAAFSALGGYVGGSAPHVSPGDALQPQEKLTGLADPSQRPTLWQLREALPAPVTRFDPDAPIIDVGEEAGMTPLGPDDLNPTIDVQITQEIIDKANELGTPEAMYEFVRNECVFQAYYGSQKGSVETLRQRAGNDYDLASLLIALLRASDFPARYAVGMVEMDVDQVNSWLAVEDGWVAGSILFTHGLEGLILVDGGGNVVAVRARRVWVEALVPRGHGSPTWVPLDPAFGLTTVHEGLDIPEEMGLDAQTFVDEYFDPSDPSVTLPRPETVLELLLEEITDYLDVNYPGMTLADVIRTHEIAPENLGVLPASLPYTVRSRDTSFSEIPADRRYQIRFHLYNGGTDLIDHTVDLPTIASKRLTISYVGATQADQDIIDGNNGLLNTAPNLIDIKPLLKVGGETVATGATGIGAGRPHSSDMYFLAPVNAQGYPVNVVPAIFNSITAGEYQAIGLSVDGVTNPLLAPVEPADEEGFLAQLRYATAMGYMERCIVADDDVGALLHVKVTRDIADAIVKDQILVSTDGGGNPVAWEWVGLTVDADRKIIGAWKVDEYETGCGGDGKEVLVLGGAQGSQYENLIFEEVFYHEAVSTIKILELAADAGITIYHHWGTVPLPANTLPAYVRSAIENAIADGHEVTFPADQITHFNWTGVGYIDMDPCNGAAGYIIAGGQNGGSTVDEWTDIVDIDEDLEFDYIEGWVIRPVADSPDENALFPKWNTDTLDLRYRLRVHYKNPTSQGAWLPDDPPPAPDYFPYPGDLSPSMLPVDHYELIVGDQGAQHIRRFTVFDFTGVLTPDDNFAGRSQDNYGIEEIVALTSTITPVGLTASQIGGLRWSIHSGVGNLSNVTNTGTATYDARESAGNVELRLVIQSGPHQDKYKPYAKSVVAPTGTRMTRTNTNVWHDQGSASAGIELHYWLDPKTVSFQNLDFGEGSSPATNVSGFYLTCWPWNSYPNGGPIAGHSQNTFGAIFGGNSTTGCRVVFVDHAGTGAANPYAAGSFTWVIPSEYMDDAAGRHSFGSQTHVGTFAANGDATQTKGGQSGSAALNDPSSGY